MAKKDELSKVYGQFESLHEEMGVLVKKNPNETLNPFKVKLLNGLLERANTLLGDDKPLPEFSEFNSDELPSASDAAIVLGLYKKAIWRAL